MKIAMLSHLASAAAPTGAERSLAVLARGLSARGHEVAVTAPGRWSLDDELAEAGLPVTSIPVKPCWLVQWGSQPLWLQTLRGMRYAMPDLGARVLLRWLSELAPDVVHVNCLPHLRGAAAAKGLGLPVVWHVREMLPAGPRRSWFAGRLRSDASRIVAVSEAVAGWLREEGLGERVEVIHNGVDLPADSADSDSARNQFNLPPDAIVVGMFSQLVAHKGALDLVRAAHIVCHSNDRLRFLIAGSGPASFASELAREILDGPAAGQFQVVPPQPEIWELLAAVDLVALPTLWPDPLPRVVMEAMAAGKPVVAYENGGVPEMVADGETGRLCRPGDVEELAQVIIELIRDERQRDRLGEAGRVRARELFSARRHVARMEEALDRAVRTAADR
jgi:glycosyltransferase involved in cell wall biosynthesis